MDSLFSYIIPLCLIVSVIFNLQFYSTNKYLFNQTERLKSFLSTLDDKVALMIDVKTGEISDYFKEEHRHTSYAGTIALLIILLKENNAELIKLIIKKQEEINGDTSD